MEKQRWNILVTGALGQLGQSVREAAKGSSDNYIFTDINELDITDRDAVELFVSKNDIHVIINCAAYTNVDAAEDNEAVAEKLNGEAPGILAHAISRRNGHLIHISTDYVFGGAGKNIPLSENEAPSPTGVYGLTKLHGEQQVIDAGSSAVILRTSWLYSDYGRNFVSKILGLLNGRDVIKVVFDQCGTPTYATDLAEAIVNIITNRKISGNEGIYNYSNEGVCSWYDFASAIVNIGCLKNKTVLPCHSSEFPSKVVRPPYSVLDKTKFKETFNLTIPNWFDSLRKCLKKYERENILNGPWNRNF